MVAETILQHPILIRFAYPFFLVFFVVFAVLEKTQVLGDKNKQIDALVAFVVGLIVVAVASPTAVISNMVLFLSVALIVLFVVLLLWGFAIGGKADLNLGEKTWVKYLAGLVILVLSLVALIWASGFQGGVSGFFGAVFGQSWSEAFWTNTIFVVLVGIALALVLKSSSK